MQNLIFPPCSGCAGRIFHLVAQLNRIECFFCIMKESKCLRLTTHIVWCLQKREIWSSGILCMENYKLFEWIKLITILYEPSMFICLKIGKHFSISDLIKKSLYFHHLLYSGKVRFLKFLNSYWQCNEHRLEIKFQKLMK